MKQAFVLSVLLFLGACAGANTLTTEAECDAATTCTWSQTAGPALPNGGRFPGAVWEGRSGPSPVLPIPTSVIQSGAPSVGR